MKTIDFHVYNVIDNKTVGPTKPKPPKPTGLSHFSELVRHNSLFFLSALSLSFTANIESAQKKRERERDFRALYLSIFFIEACKLKTIS